MGKINRNIAGTYRNKICGLFGLEVGLVVEIL